MDNGSRIDLFDGVALDLARCCLIRKGQPVHLRPQSYDVLKYLVQNKDRLVNKDKLIEEVWQGRAVTDSSLVKCIEEVREALGPDASRYVRTVRGRGYIFDTGLEESTEALTRSERVDVIRVTVEEHEDHDQIQSAPSSRLRSPVEPSQTRLKYGTLVMAAAGFVVIIVAVIVGYRFLTRGPSPSGSIKSIAVLPFQNESGNADVDYLSEGVSESLINRLSQLRGVKVIARTSSFKYKAKDVDPQEVARALGVEAILTGRVAQRGDNVLISAELVDARDKTQMWGEQYNRRSSDLIAVQSDISREIADTLRLRLTASEQKQLARHETVNPQAYELLLKGRFFRSNHSWKKAIDYFNQTIAADPACADAYAGLALGYSSLVTASVLDPKDFIPKAEASAYKALELDESLPDAHLALAGTKLIAWDWAAAEREFKRAIELNPNLAGARSFYSLYLSIMGRHDEALAEIKRARELDPLSPTINAEFASRLFQARQYDQAVETAKNTLEMDQNRPDTHLLLGHIYAAKGRYAEAIAAFEEGVKLGDDSPDTQVYLGAAYAHAGERGRAIAILTRFESAREYVSPGALAVLYVALGQREKAFASLERAYAEHDNQLQFLRVDQNFDPLRSDPRFQDLVRRVGLTS